MNRDQAVMAFAAGYEAGARGVRQDFAWKKFYAELPKRKRRWQKKPKGQR